MFCFRADLTAGLLRSFFLSPPCIGKETSCGVTLTLITFASLTTFGGSVLENLRTDTVPWNLVFFRNNADNMPVDLFYHADSKKNAIFVIVVIDRIVVC